MYVHAVPPYAIYEDKIIIMLYEVIRYTGRAYPHNSLMHCMTVNSIDHMIDTLTVTHSATYTSIVCTVQYAKTTV